MANISSFIGRMKEFAANKRAAIRSNKFLYATIVVVGYQLFVVSIVTGFIAPYLGGFTSGMGVIGSAVTVAVSEAPLVYVLDKYIF